ncbi:MAG: phage integrase family protein [Edaphobacter sp.]|nr:phage integrase family protein [Edaphobacter sp.]
MCARAQITLKVTVLADLEGKGRRIRTVAIPIWVKHGINAWMTAAGIEDGRLLRSVSKSGKVNRDTLSDWAVWSVVEQSSKQIGIEHFGAPTTSVAPAPSCAGRTVGIWSRSSSCWGTRPSRRQSVIWGRSKTLRSR